MACGTLVLSSDNSENIYWLKENGLLYKTNDVLELSKKILSSIEIPIKKKQQLVRKARKKIESENDFKKEMMKMNQFYKI